jgi:transcriptional regulator with XRE-family HTH domain
MKNRNFANRITIVIRHIENTQHLNRKEIAARIGVSPQMLRLYEQGSVTHPYAMTIFRLRDLSGFNARWLALGEGPRHGGEEPAKPLLDRKMQLPLRDRRSIDRIIEGLILLNRKQGRTPKGNIHS